MRLAIIHLMGSKGKKIALVVLVIVIGAWLFMGAPTQTKSAAVAECQLNVRRSQGALYGQPQVNRLTWLCMQTKGFVYTWGNCNEPSKGGAYYWCYRRKRLDEVAVDLF